jgi:hypothetical protein
MANVFAPPVEHASHQWHFVKTEHGMMVARWFPYIGNGMWEIGGHTKEADDKNVVFSWDYYGPVVLPETRKEE